MSGTIYIRSIPWMSAVEMWAHLVLDYVTKLPDTSYVEPKPLNWSVTITIDAP